MSNYKLGDKVLGSHNKIGTIVDIETDEIWGDYVTIDWHDGKEPMDGIGPNLVKWARQNYIDNVENKGKA